SRFRHDIDESGTYEIEARTGFTLPEDLTGCRNAYLVDGALERGVRLGRQLIEEPNRQFLPGRTGRHPLRVGVFLHSRSPRMRDPARIKHGRGCQPTRNSAPRLAERHVTNARRAVDRSGEAWQP